MKYLICIIVMIIFVIADDKNSGNVAVEFHISKDNASATVSNLNFDRHYFAKLDDLDSGLEKKFFLFDPKALITQKYLSDKNSVYSMEEFISFKFKSTKVLENIRNLIFSMANKKSNYTLSLTVYSIDGSNTDEKYLDSVKPKEYEYKTCVTEKISAYCYDKTEFIPVNNKQTNPNKNKFFLMENIPDEFF